MAQVLVTSRLALEASEIAAALPDHEVSVPSGAALDRAALLTRIASADALVCLLTDRVDAELLRAAPRLRIVANHAVGVDNVDVAACSARGVLVANTPDVLTEATADLAWTLVLATARRLLEGDALVRGGAWTGWEPTQLLGRELAGLTLGLVGLGRIGRAVARRAGAFGVRVIYAAPRRASAEVEAALAATHVELDALCATADVISLHCPLSDATRGLFGAARLATLRPDAILINTARGALVDEDALAAALVAGRLGAAGLDVYAHEPRVTEALRAAPRTVLLPHVGSATGVTRRRMATLCLEAVADALAGRRPRHLVDPAAWSQA